MTPVLGPLPHIPCRAGAQARQKSRGPNRSPKQNRPASSRPGGDLLSAKRTHASGGLDLGLLGGGPASLGALGQHLGDALYGAALVELLDRGDLAPHAMEGRL